ncbi:MAG: VCBS repeat-containing protein [Candidatus Krumholzibacteria bacterium]|nr:VCBS repeat-containing protein [Candidatus Krumholzibacteria bacterium]
MRNIRNTNSTAGFTLIEILLSILMLGFVLISFAGILTLYQKSSAQTTDFAEVQQNTRIALDYITDDLRQAGSQTDYFRGQRPIVHAGAYQVAFNADIDNGQTIDGMSPLTAINPAVMPNTVPASGTIIYTPAADYQSDAETVVFTLDSNGDGVISSADRGDDPEESGRNRNLFILKKVVYGHNEAGTNEIRESNIAQVRGPNLAPTWTIPQPLFQYYYDHDEDPSTADRLWGDGNNNGVLETGEITALTPMPQNLLSTIRKVKITAISESNKYNKRFETNGGFLNVTMTSKVYVRNATLTSALIHGKVFHDADSDGVMDPGETGIPGVEIRLAGQSRSVLTDNFGLFYFALPAGNYSIQEVDPPGYTSTTANLVSVTLVSGQSQVVNFGDISSSPIGVIQGTVFEDVDKDGVKSVGERGIASVLISLDNGAQTLTNDNGYYSFIAEQGNYTVVETDPTSYSSTTPNSQTANIVAADDTVTVNFGDYAGPVYGTLEGYVFLDTNENGVRNSREEGLPNVTLKVSNGDTTMTNANGFYRFNLEPGTYSITETDPAGYTSTTVNAYVDIPITADTTVIRNFGDILENLWDFVEIHISNTDRVLSVCTVNLKEDDKNDMDIVLGTALANEIGNMLIFHNKWQSSTTPVGELFDSDPVYRRDAGNNINAMNKYDFSGDGTPDVFSGLDNSTERNIQIWFTGNDGILSMTPDAAYYASGLNQVMDSKPADFDEDGNIDLLVGLKSSIGSSGAFETFRGIGNGTFAHWQYITAAGSENNLDLGEIWAVETGDIDGDGDEDVIVGSHATPYAGYIDIYINTGYASGDLAWHSRYLSSGAVNDLKAIDMKEDDGNDTDILAAVTIADNAGKVLLWLNANGTFGIPDTTGYSFGSEETPNWPDDYVNAQGEALSLGILDVNNDVFPDVAFGTRSSILYTGDIYILPAYGTLPSSGQKINYFVSGEVITMDVADFNKDSRPDIVVGTRSAAAQGRLAVYFGRKR